MNCKFYSEEICKCLFDGPPDDCTFENNEDNCTCFKPIKENNNGSKNMKKCKFYLRSPNGADNRCLNPHCELKKCWFTDLQNECENFEPHEEDTLYRVMKERIEDNKEQLFTIGSSVSNQDLICHDCERVIFIGKKLGNVAEIDADKISKIDSIEVNGIKFKKV